MRIAVLADPVIRQEMIFKGTGENEIIWADTIKVLEMPSDVDVYFDLEFVPDNQRLGRLKQLQGPIFINAVEETISELGPNFIRLNAWPTFINRPVIEVAAKNEENVQGIMDALGWKYQVVPDIPGMLTPRVIAMIINEAYFTLEQQVSTKDEIDTAMKLGTNYPYGPFEWADKIGLKKIHSLLGRLAKDDERYRSCELLAMEAHNEILRIR